MAHNTMEESPVCLICGCQLVTVDEYETGICSCCDSDEQDELEEEEEAAWGMFLVEEL